MSNTGIYLFGCIYGIEAKNTKIFDEYFNQLINMKNIGTDLELELLYGITGYLYALLFLKKYLLSVKKELSFVKEEKILDNTIIDVFNEIISTGIAYMQSYKWNKCLVYPFPIGDEPEFYLGAAHGLIGVIYLILCTIKTYPNLMTNNSKTLYPYENLSDLIKRNLDYIKSLQIESSGNFPDDIEGKDKGKKVHFCHGCVGAVHLFLLAEEIFPGNDYLMTAKNCNKSLWDRGILYKGNGVCHGMSGICFALMKLYEYTKDSLYLKEAIGIAKATYDPEIQKLVKAFKDPQRKKIGMPDTPYSLMEGLGGQLIMYYDLIDLINNVKNDMTNLFPGYEIY
jgi:hypothetical protein